MKKLQLLFVCIFCIQLITNAQSDRFNYQGVARNASGAALANTNLGIKISIISSTPTGTVEYEETHTITTNDFGLYNLNIGGGTVITGSIATINWGAANHFVKVEMDPNGGTTYQDLGTHQLLTVPYAKQASALTIYPSGTANPDKLIIGHSPAFQNYGLLYNDMFDIFKFISSSSEVFNINLSTNSIEYPHPSKGLGKTLVSDANGVATWQDKGTKFTEITMPGCPSLANVTSTATLLANLGTFTKQSGETNIDVLLSTHFFVGTMAANGVIFELRVNNVACNIGNGAFLLKSASQVQGSINAIFSNLPAGTHTISMWVRSHSGTASSVILDSGCWNSQNTNSLVVKEYY